MSDTTDQQRMRALLDRQRAAEGRRATHAAQRVHALPWYANRRSMPGISIRRRRKA